MRLAHIHLAGFKSFVDPVTIPTKAMLTGIVGPNGCGKSNVIDAVHWVLGESKARELGGESLQDVIFNGSATRKPAARALVELLFDNSDGARRGSGHAMPRSPSSACSPATANPLTTSTMCTCASATWPFWARV